MRNSIRKRLINIARTLIPEVNNKSDQGRPGDEPDLFHDLFRTETTPSCSRSPNIRTLLSRRLLAGGFSLALVSSI